LDGLTLTLTLLDGLTLSLSLSLTPSLSLTLTATRSAGPSDGRRDSGLRPPPRPRPPTAGR
jgi:hypothetical protein